jgi:hypothetical protein
VPTAARHPVKAAPQPVDARVPPLVRAALVELCGCDDGAIRLETRLGELPLTTWQGPDGACSDDLVELVITLEEAYGISLEEQQDVIDATWASGTVQTVIETLRQAGVDLGVSYGA